MNKSLHTVEMTRLWRQRVHREVSGMSQAEKVAYFAQFDSVAVLEARSVPTQALPAALPVKRKKGFDAVAESRKWREATSRKLDSMSQIERTAHLQSVGERNRAELRVRRPVPHAA